MLRSRLEAGLAAIFALLALLTSLWPDWIERFTGLEPDGGSGDTEWALVALFALLAVAAGLLARRDHLRARRIAQAMGGVAP